MGPWLFGLLKTVQWNLGGNSDKEASQWALKQESKDGVNSYSEPGVSQSVVYGPHTSASDRGVW